MTKPLPIKLPPGFDWLENTADDTGARSVEMKVREQPVLRIIPKRSGWLVVIDLKDPATPQADVAVHSIAAGMRWAARWVQGRAKRLNALASIPAGPMIRQPAAWAGASARGGGAEQAARER